MMRSVNNYADEVLILVDKSGTHAQAKEFVINHTFEQFKDFLNASYQMRRFQRQYFKHRDTVSLVEAQNWERIFDKLLNQLIDEKKHPHLL